MNRLFLCKPVYNEERDLLHEVNPLVLYMIKKELLGQPLIVICSNPEQKKRVSHYLRKHCKCYRMTFTWKEVWEEQSEEEVERLMEMTDDGTYIFCSDNCSEVDMLYKYCDSYTAF
jgi:hypothetical protein